MINKLVQYVIGEVFCLYYSLVEYISEDIDFKDNLRFTVVLIPLNLNVEWNNDIIGVSINWYTHVLYL